MICFLFNRKWVTDAKKTVSVSSKATTPYESGSRPSSPLKTGSHSSSPPQTGKGKIDGYNSVKHEQEVFRNMSNCDNSYIPTIITKSEIFQKVDAKGGFFVMSAFYDEGKVRVFGVQARSSVTVFCKLWYKNDTSPQGFWYVTTMATTGERLNREGGYR